MKSIRNTKKQRKQKRILEEIKRQHLESSKRKQEINQAVILIEESKRIKLQKRRHEDIISQYDGQLSESELQRIATNGTIAKNGRLL
jgi:predicted Zn-dependent protease